MADADSQEPVAGAMTLRERVANALDGHDPFFGRSIAFFLQGLIVLSIISLSDWFEQSGKVEL